MEARAGPPMLSVVALFSFRKIVEIWSGSVRLRDDGSVMPSEGWPPGLFASTAGERINGITGSGALSLLAVARRRPGTCWCVLNEWNNFRALEGVLLREISNFLNK